MTRIEHLNWCKERALEYLANDDLKNAYASMISDLTKHPETENHPATELGTILMMDDKLSTQLEMRRFIEGFN